MFRNLSWAALATPLLAWECSAPEDELGLASAAVAIATTEVTGTFFANPNNACSFFATPATTAVFTQRFPTINFNPPPGTIPGNVSGVNTNTRPFTDILTDAAGNFSGTLVAAGNGLQAGVGSLVNFQAVFTGDFVVAAAGDFTLNVFSDDGFILGIGGGATRVSGPVVNPPPSGRTAFEGVPVVASFNVPSSPTVNTMVIHFPAPGVYHYEADYTECFAGALAFTLAVPGGAIPPIINQPPVARCTDINLDAGDTCQATGSVDDGSIDPDEGDTITCVQDPRGPYALGATAVTLTCTDSHQASASCIATVTVVDVTPPVIQPIGAPISLWPPNHEMHTYAVGDCVASVTDNCATIDPATDGAFSRAMSDEAEDDKLSGSPRGDGNTCSDIELEGANASLRAERLGGGDGRVYSLDFTVSDPSGNSASAGCEVQVVHDQSAASAPATRGPCAYCVGADCPGGCPGHGPLCSF